MNLQLQQAYEEYIKFLEGYIDKHIIVAIKEDIDKCEQLKKKIKALLDEPSQGTTNT